MIMSMTAMATAAADPGCILLAGTATVVGGSGVGFTIFSGHIVQSL